MTDIFVDNYWHNLSIKYYQGYIYQKIFVVKSLLIKHYYQRIMVIIDRFGPLVINVFLVVLFDN